MKGKILGVPLAIVLLLALILGPILWGEYQIYQVAKFCKPVEIVPLADPSLIATPSTELSPVSVEEIVEPTKVAVPVENPLPVTNVLPE